MPIVDLKNISFSYKIDSRSVDVLSNVSLSVERGEFIAIQGPSGSGKSTLLYLIGCLLKPQVGRLYVAGHDVSLCQPSELALLRNRNIGFVFQQFHLLPRASVIENICMPTFYPCEHLQQNVTQARVRACELAKLLGLGDRTEHLPNQLSGGQQQRVAIARALINDAPILLADEPTGNLDSRTSEEIISLLKELNTKGKTVILITHDSEIARHCDKIFHLKDGKITQTEELRPRKTIPEEPKSERKFNPSESIAILSLLKSLLPLAFENLTRNKIRSVLTMMGITIGVAAVIAMVTLGQFTKQKILDSYAELGVNTMMFYGYRNWELKATDVVPLVFQSFDWEKDLLALKKIFPQIHRIAPVMISWNSTAHFAGKQVDTDVRAIGTNEEAYHITNRQLIMGSNFSPYHLENKSSVCIIGYEIAARLFSNMNPLGQVLEVHQNEQSTGCRVIGVFKQSPSSNQWLKPDFQVVFPFTYFQANSGNWWEQQIREVMIQVRPGEDIEKVGKTIQAFFERKYGKSGRFRVDSDSVLLAQMKKFLSLFTLMLGSIALLSLGVGGIGITNMMLVSVSERYREIGLRKAVGATDRCIRVQFLVESLLVCILAGILGLIIGFTSYELIIFGASKFVSKLKFEWVVDAGAVCLSLSSILAVGIISGFFPALKAEKLQVIEALRSE